VIFTFNYLHLYLFPPKIVSWSVTHTFMELFVVLELNSTSPFVFKARNASYQVWNEMLVCL